MSRSLIVTKTFIPVCEPALLGNERKYVMQALEDAWISSNGEFIPKFENVFARYCGLAHGVAVCNGTAALHLALRALGIQAGDEVIIPTFTMIATAFAVCYTGAKPVFVDADGDTWNIDPVQIEAKITKRTKAILPVHIMGLACEMDTITRIAKEHGLFIIEDAAQAHGAEYKKQKVASFSDIACFSFYANKNLTAGEGGICVTDDENLYDKLRYYKNLCFPLTTNREYTHEEIGFNYRMSNLHAAIALAQVEKADDYRSMRRHNAALYAKYLSSISGISFQKDDDADYLHAHWMNALKIDASKYALSRDALMEKLKMQQIDSRKLFTPMHEQKALKDYGCDYSGTYLQSEALAAQGLYLPSASSLQEEEIRYICEFIARWAA